MSSPAAGCVTISDIKSARDYIRASGLVRRTPLLRGFEFPIVDRNGADGTATPEVYLKMESLQRTGSFKIRGMTNCFRVHEESIRARGAVTLSAGNAGRSFAFLCGRLGVTATVCMPNTVPRDRVRTIEGLGSTVELVPGVALMDAVRRYVDGEGRTLIHPFDDADLIAGHGSVGLEILEDIPDLGAEDVVAVCCGGGGLVAGVAAALKLSGCEARVVAVEPEGSPCMTASMRLGRPAVEPEDFITDTIAHGLAPPFAGTITFAHVKKFVDDVVTITDLELVAATRKMYGHGFVVETSGCAGLAAAMAGKLGLRNTGRIVCVVSGSNISTRDMDEEAGNEEGAETIVNSTTLFSATHGWVAAAAILVGVGIGWGLHSRTS